MPVTASNEEERAKFARIHDFTRLPKGGMVSVVESHLDTNPGSGGSGNQWDQFDAGARRRLLDQHMLARLNRRKGNRRHPFIGGGNKDGVHVRMANSLRPIGSSPCA